MGFLKKLLKKTVKEAMKTPKQSVTRGQSERKPLKQATSTPAWTEEDLAYTIKLDAWLRGVELYMTGLHKKHPEVIKRSQKALIEESLKEHGAVTLEYGREEELGDFFLIATNENSFKCRELPDSYCGEAADPPLKTFKYDKVQLQKFISGVDNEYQESVRKNLAEAEGKTIDSLSIDYIDEKTGKAAESLALSPNLRVDGEFLYFKEKPNSKKEKQVRLKWIEDIDIELEYDDEDE